MTQQKVRTVQALDGIRVHRTLRQIRSIRRIRKSFALIERYATDERNFVKKGVSWALRGIGKRKSPALRATALVVARRMAKSDHSTVRWIGKDALETWLANCARAGSSADNNCAGAGSSAQGSSGHNGLSGFDGELPVHFLINNQVASLVAQRFARVADQDCELSAHLVPLGPELPLQRHDVQRFYKPLAQIPVDLEERADCQMCEVFVKERGRHDKTIGPTFLGASPFQCAPYHSSIPDLLSDQDEPSAEGPARAQLHAGRVRAGQCSFRHDARRQRCPPCARPDEMT